MHLSQSSSHRTTRFLGHIARFDQFALSKYCPSFTASRTATLEYDASHIQRSHHEFISRTMLSQLHFMFSASKFHLYIFLDPVDRYLTNLQHFTIPQASFFSNDDVLRSCYPFCRKSLCLLCILPLPPNIYGVFTEFDSLNS
jgi:hypothetical protein